MALDPLDDDWMQTDQLQQYRYMHDIVSMKGLILLSNIIK